MKERKSGPDGSWISEAMAFGTIHVLFYVEERQDDSSMGGRECFRERIPILRFKMDILLFFFNWAAVT
jgi:hypothetical protein